jgi:methyl-accepting chemotaxis protein
VDWIVAVVPFLDEFLGPIRQIGAFIGIAIAIAAAVGVILSALLGTAISRPIRAVAERTSELAEGAGDLTFRFSTRQRDETGDLARHFNAFLETLQEVVRNVKATADEAEGLKTTVVSTSDQTTVATNEITANVSSLKELGTKLRSSVEKATGAVRSIQTALERFAHEVDEEASAVEESSSSIEEMAASITAIAQTSERRAADAGKVTQSTDHGRVVAGEISQNVEQFVRRLEEIRQASSLIQDVAAQTNLLAMNAAIEAAHAGDAGRGFAVVAGEIRKLAEETSTRSASINESVQGFNHDIEALVESNDSVQESFGEIQQRVSDFVAGFTEIQGTTRELSVGANEIVNAIQVLRTGSSNVQSGTGDISRQTDVIADVMRDVQGATQSLASALDEVSQGLAEINEGSVNLRDGIVRLGDTVDSMASGVRSFRTE